MTAPIHECLADIAARFTILPPQLADALDVYGPDATAWAWIDANGRLVRFQVDEQVQS